MIRRLLPIFLAFAGLGPPAAATAQAKDELVVAMTQMPGTWNPIISSMLAKSLIANMTARPVTAYDADTGKQLWRFDAVPDDPAKPAANKA